MEWGQALLGAEAAAFVLANLVALLWPDAGTALTDAPGAISALAICGVVAVAVQHFRARTSLAESRLPEGIFLAALFCAATYSRAGLVATAALPLANPWGTVAVLVVLGTAFRQRLVLLPATAFTALYGAFVAAHSLRGSPVGFLTCGLLVVVALVTATLRVDHPAPTEGLGSSPWSYYSRSFYWVVAAVFVVTILVCAIVVSVDLHHP